MVRERGEKRDDYVWHKNNAKGLKGSLEIWRRCDIIRIV